MSESCKDVVSAPVVAREQEAGSGKESRSGKTIGRPRVHDRLAVARDLFRVMAAGGTLKSACAAVGIKPAHVIRWAASDKIFREAFSRAREQQAHALIDEALSIADEPVADMAGAARNRLRVETRKWFASKIVPRLYGTREALEVSGPQGAPIAVRVLFQAEGRRATLAAIAAAGADADGTPTGADAAPDLLAPDEDELWSDSAASAAPAAEPPPEGAGAPLPGDPAGGPPIANPSGLLELQGV